MKAQTYINRLHRNLCQIRPECYCSDAVINAVVSYYAAKSGREEIRFSALIQISGRLPVEDLDIGAVLSNALENAYNACQGLTGEPERFIALKFILHRRQYLLDVSNSFDGAVAFDDAGRLLSEKDDHGIGSQSIFAFAKKYNATVDYSVKGCVFNIRIMFSGPQTEL